MKRILSLFCSLLLIGTLLSGAVIAADAYTPGEPFRADLSQLMHNPDRRRYVEMMTDYYVRNNAAVRKSLRDGLCAMFLFEGCSDNLDDETLSDLSYYRVSAVCLVVRLDTAGEPYISYFNQNCSTIPDRPLEYGAWELEGVGQVGPATVRDGTYELYSVKHMGAYEALHLRDSEDDGEISAVYMTPDGFTTADADCINIHTRTGNHTAGRGMWSAGCMLVGDGDFGQFEELMESTYYTLYSDFDVGRRVGTVTINRQNMTRKLYSLYKSKAAVNRILESSASEVPETYLADCTMEAVEPENRGMRTVEQTELMSLPCSNETDARSIPIQSVPKGTRLEVSSTIRNSRGSVWYEVCYGVETCYVYSGNVEKSTWLNRFLDFFTR
ncbi:MAG: hypothetical protein PUD80_06500 [Firmicutes bacterium]|nr:hypothetical protein [Bacillota bacterium]